MCIRDRRRSDSWDVHDCVAPAVYAGSGPEVEVRALLLVGGGVLFVLLASSVVRSSTASRQGKDMPGLVEVGSSGDEGVSCGCAEFACRHFGETCNVRLVAVGQAEVVFRAKGRDWDSSGFEALTLRVNARKEE